MSEKKKYIKIFDKKIAEIIESGGFLYMKEKINDNQTVYVFDEDEAIYEILNQLREDGNYQEITYITEESLCF